MVMGTARAQAGMAMVDYHLGDVVSFRMFYGEQCLWLMGIVSYHKHIIINDLECHILSIKHIISFHKQLLAVPILSIGI